MAEVKNLLFDLGGVVIDLDRMRCVRAFEAAGLGSANELLGEYKQSGAFLQLEEGLITPEEFRAELRKHFEGEASDQTIDDCFMQFLLGIPVHRLRQMEQLHAKYNIYIISNTNAIMFAKTIPDFFRIDGHDINYYADGVVTSFDVKCCKPDAKIFNICLERFGIKAEETLLFDDSQANCDAAARLGFQTYTVAKGTEFYDYFK